MQRQSLLPSAHACSTPRVTAPCLVLDGRLAIVVDAWCPRYFKAPLSLCPAWLLSSLSDLVLAVFPRLLAVHENTPVRHCVLSRHERVRTIYVTAPTRQCLAALSFVRASRTRRRRADCIDDSVKSQACSVLFLATTPSEVSIYRACRPQPPLLIVRRAFESLVGGVKTTRNAVWAGSPGWCF